MRLAIVGRHVEGAVAGDLERARGIDQRLGARLVDPAIRRQAADDDAGDAQILHRLDVIEHGGKFQLGIEEVAAARADDDVERDGRHAHRLAHHAQAWRQPAFEQARAQLHPIRPGRLRGHQAINTLDADLDLERQLAHEWSPIGTILVVRVPAPGKPQTSLLTRRLSVLQN